MWCFYYSSFYDCFHLSQAVKPRSSTAPSQGKTENRTAVAVSINDNKRFYVDEQAVTKGRLQQVLLERLQTTAQPSIVLRAAKTVPVDLVVFVMDIANRNGIKVVLAVESP